ncbi:MAG TPA: PH domain-containing protein [Candidatus Onthousia faecipullorum]|uniref:PH domain-containing protein n=1 Tax=Candidatus Onthousia faecipullorum TaxID=2840887 RepID=A0A9D1GB23_9FIRM|nr:PH domain-containing protein [Candidatus Onthousia faecipullorum]
MAYIKFKELSKYFDFKEEIATDKLPDYAREYVSSKETILGSYKNSKDYAVFTDKKMILFDRDTLAVYYKKIHIFPYTSISSSAINFKPGKVELLFSFDSGYQLHINFIEMNHDKKEKLKSIYKIMMESKLY